jgi:branched-chain amino acid transport system substrate-binding protein
MEIDSMLTRRSTFKVVAGVAATAALGTTQSAQAADQVVKIALEFSFTGGDATAAQRAAQGAMMAIDEANAAKTVPGIKFEYVKFDDGTATSGQYDPAQGATNARKMISDKEVMASVGPQMSGVGKAMSPILSSGNLATITPSSTNPDITDPKFASQYIPNGKPIYFRTVATDAYQGPYMANFMIERLKVATIYVLDDTGAYGVGIADAFQAAAEKKGAKILGRDKLDPKAADYSAVLTKIKSLNPDALYYGGVGQAGIKLMKQSYEIIPKVIKAGGDGVFGADMLTGAGFPAVEGWYATQASPHVIGDPKLAQWSKAYTEKYKMGPDDYTVTAYDAAIVIISAVKNLKSSGKAVTRDNVRDAIHAAKVDTLQGVIEFDANGDLKNKVISVFQITKNPSAPLDDPASQYKYVGAAPTV